MTQNPSAFAGKSASGGFISSPTVTDRRKQKKYRIQTTGLTERGMVRIQGAEKFPEEPHIYFSREAWVKQCHLVDICSKEVGWFAMVDYDEELNVFCIDEIVIPEQTVSASETDIDKDNMADAALELIEQGKDTSKLYAWFHSHVNMGVSPSAQDEYQVEEFLEDLADQPEVPAFIRGIQNKKGDLKLDVYFIQHGIAYQNVDFSVIHDDDPQWEKDVEALVKDRVTEQTYMYRPWQDTQKKASANESAKLPAANNAGNGLRRNDYGYNGYRGYGGYGSYDPYYDEMYDDFSFKPEAPEKSYKETTDYSDVLTPLNYLDEGYPEIRNLDVLYTSTSGEMEVLLDNQTNALYVELDTGELYHYDEFTDVFGEIDAPAST
jgi:hypothetical protein